MAWDTVSPLTDDLRRYADHRYEVVGVSLDPPDATCRYSEALELPFDVVSISDPNGFADRYRVDMVPLTIHLGTDGRVRGAWLGVLSDQVVEDI